MSNANEYPTQTMEESRDAWKAIATDNLERLKVLSGKLAVKEQENAELKRIIAESQKQERERIANQFDEAGWHPYAELVRKGE